MEKTRELQEGMLLITKCTGQLNHFIVRWPNLPLPWLDKGLVRRTFTACFRVIGFNTEPKKATHKRQRMLL